MESQKYILGTILYIVAVYLGTMVVQMSWDGQSYALYFGEDRKPAAYIKSLDFSPLNGHHLQVRSQKRLLDEANVHVSKTHIEIQLGLFTVRDPSTIVTRPTLACNVYETIKVVFIAEGMAVSDSSPLLQVSAPCNSNVNTQEMLTTIKIPLKVLQSRNVASDFSENLIEKNIVVSIKNLSDSWPDRWSINGVRLIDDDGVELPIEVNQKYILGLENSIKERLVLSNYRPL